MVCSTSRALAAVSFVADPSERRSVPLQLPVTSATTVVAIGFSVSAGVNVSVPAGCNLSRTQVENLLVLTYAGCLQAAVFADPAAQPALDAFEGR